MGSGSRFIRKEVSPWPNTTHLDRTIIVGITLCSDPWLCLQNLGHPVQRPTDHLGLHSHQHTSISCAAHANHTTVINDYTISSGRSLLRYIQSIVCDTSGGKKFRSHVTLLHCTTLSWKALNRNVHKASLNIGNACSSTPLESVSLNRARGDLRALQGDVL